MWALVESNSVSKIYTRPTAITIGFVAATYYTEEVLYADGDDLPEDKSIGDVGKVIPKEFESDMSNANLENKNNKILDNDLIITKKIKLNFNTTSDEEDKRYRDRLKTNLYILSRK